MKKSQLKALIREVIEEMSPEMIGAKANPKSKNYSIQSQGFGMYYIVDLDTKQNVKVSPSWKGIKQKWKELTGEEWLEEPYDS